MRKWATAAADSNEIDMTPMLDVVFILLIFFIVTSSFLKASALDLARPSRATPAPGPVPALLVLDVGADNRIVSGGRELDPAAVPALLQQRLSAEPTTAVLIQAHHDSQTALLIRLADAARAAGIDRVSVASLGSR